MRNKAIPVEQTKYETDFRDRLTRMRNTTGMNQEDFAKALGIKRDAYSKYESRAGSVLPMYLIPRLIQITGFESWYVLTGQPGSKAPTSPWSKERIAELLRPPHDVIAQREKERRHLTTRKAKT